MARLIHPVLFETPYRRGGTQARASIVVLPHRSFQLAIDGGEVRYDRDAGMTPSDSPEKRQRGFTPYFKSIRIPVSFDVHAKGEHPSFSRIIIAKGTHKVSLFTRPGCTKIEWKSY
jgi:hypothetical protein